MISFDEVPVYLACGATDLRKQINGLSILVSSGFELDVFSPALFVFCNRARTLIRVLAFDTDGFILYTKRLERGRFKWPVKTDKEDVMELESCEFSQLLSSTKLDRRIRREEIVERSVC
ncbi:MAG: IS66 family insertion sequence element accessory protein TnpB [Coriobacteriales bacterium]|jgi:transposase|nr:IS66 family insertion sequence element accessory protein TnpB [Coriobacteriales bacterium]